MWVDLSEEELKALIEGNIKKNRNIYKYRPYTYPYTYWVDEGRKDKVYHCAICGHKSNTVLEQCPECKSDVIKGFGTDTLIRYKVERWR